MTSQANTTKFLYWNTGRQSIASIVALASQQYGLDLILLAECRDPNSILMELNRSTDRPFIHQKREAGCIDIFCRFPIGNLDILGDHHRMSFLHLRPPIGNDILVTAVHLPSKRNMQDSNQTFHCTRLIRKVGEFESRLGHGRTVVVGDFNINPFEDGLIAAEGFHASPSRHIAKRKSRIVQNTAYTFFYNPMWAHFGDRAEGPPGTYYYNGSNSTNIYWNMFDQVLIRPDLLDQFDDESVHILTKINDTALMSEKGTPNISDHFPIMFALNLLEAQNGTKESVGRAADGR